VGWHRNCMATVGRNLALESMHLSEEAFAASRSDADSKASADHCERRAILPISKTIMTVSMRYND
jgi:hypothetical protein